MDIDTRRQCYAGNLQANKAHKQRIASQHAAQSLLFGSKIFLSLSNPFPGKHTMAWLFGHLYSSHNMNLAAVFGLCCSVTVKMNVKTAKSSRRCTQDTEPRVSQVLRPLPQARQVIRSSIGDSRSPKSQMIPRQGLKTNQTPQNTAYEEIIARMVI